MKFSNLKVQNGRIKILSRHEKLQLVKDNVLHDAYYLAEH